MAKHKPQMSWRGLSVQWGALTLAHTHTHSHTLSVPPVFETEKSLTLMIGLNWVIQHYNITRAAVAHL